MYCTHDGSDTEVYINIFITSKQKNTKNYISSPNCVHMKYTFLTSTGFKEPQ